jgi:hypothetical protein
MEKRSKHKSTSSLESESQAISFLLSSAWLCLCSIEANKIITASPVCQPQEIEMKNDVFFILLMLSLCCIGAYRFGLFGIIIGPILGLLLWLIGYNEAKSLWKD